MHILSIANGIPNAKLLQVLALLAVNFGRFAMAQPSKNVLGPGDMVHSEFVLDVTSNDQGRNCTSKNHPGPTVAIRSDSQISLSWFEVPSRGCFAIFNAYQAGSGLEAPVC